MTAKEIEEVDYVEQCDECGDRCIGMTPDDMRAHIVEDHGDPLGDLLVWMAKDD